MLPLIQIQSYAGWPSLNALVHMMIKCIAPQNRECKELALSLASAGGSPGTCGMPAFHCTPTASRPAPRRAVRGQGRRPRWQPGGRSRKSWPTAREGTW